jgi:hypothetical protein
MAGILEFVMAVKAAEFASSGTLASGACGKHSPLSIGEIEATRLNHYSPDDYKLLVSSGVSLEDLLIEDIDMIAEIIEKLENSPSFSERGQNDQFYKHAIAIRCHLDLLLLDGTKEAKFCEADSKIIGNSWKNI